MSGSDEVTARLLCDADKALRGIERSVLDEMFLSWRLVLVLSAAFAGLLLSVAAASPAAVTAETPLLPLLSLLASGVVAVSALGGIVARRFSWACFAAFAAGMGAALSVLAFWILRTGGANSGAGWFGTTAACEVVLLFSWAGSALTPLADSQPECRLAWRARTAATRPRAHGG
ncbi:hypothetical protein [Nocardia sp. NBC_01329]|uniref:hypothetical protein n=1 Tax=Nocardia sp. NBC_01329 TaxID=2903594 RepID=UPI002E155320|nr:hypothetical protein OG405_15415 [Nocardia sp. NBC_01329]